MITCPRCATENADTARFCQNCGNPLLLPADESEKRKTVTVMFMDVVGSTGLGEKTDPESMRRVMTRYFDAIRAIVERHGGVVEKYIGDAVMAVFGVPAVHEDDALRAVRAATEIRSRLAALDADIERENGVSIAWRTGINTGEVVAGDAGAGQRFVSGDTVNVAARLEQSAAPGEIVLGSETLGLVRDVVATEPLAGIEAKGKSAPITAHRLVALAAGATSQTGRRLDSPMVGRIRQRRLMHEAFEQVVDERVCHLFTVLGAAGVGKSRLVGEFVAGVGDEALIVRGRCLSYGEGITYWPLAEGIRDLAGLDDADTDEEFRRKLAALVDDPSRSQQVVELLGVVLGRFTAAATRDEIAWAVRILLESLARRKPLVLLLDDVHWAEPTLLDLVEQLADWADDAPLLVVCVGRLELLETRPGWGGGKSYATTLTLEPLSESESRQLMVNLLGHLQLDDELVAKIAQAAEGNPLFVEEMIGMLIDNGYLRRDGTGWSASAKLTEVSVPPSIQALLAARLDGLPRPERTVIERGAVEGKVFHRSAVAELAPLDVREQISTHLRALSRKELVRPERSDFAGDEAFRFRHLLIRDAAYSAMPKAARADIHARFAEWLERSVGDHVTEYEEILGYHLEQAFRYRVELGRVDDETSRLRAAAGRHFATSGHRALRRGDIHAARKLLRSAVELMPADDRDRVPVIADLASALILGNEPRVADDLLAAAEDAARAVNDELALARIEVVRIGSLTALGAVTVTEVLAKCEALLALFERHGDDWGLERTLYELGRHYFFDGRASEAEALLTDLIQRFPEGEAPPRVVGFVMAALHWGPTTVPEALVKTQELSRSIQGRGIEAARLRFIGGLRAMAGELDEGIEMIQRSVEIDNELGRRFMANATAGQFLAPILSLAGHEEKAERILVEAYTDMAGVGDQAYSSTVAGYLAALYVKTGRFDEAEHYARITIESATHDDAEAQAQGLAAMARVQAARGEFDAAEATARHAVDVAAATDYLGRHGLVLWDLAEVLVAAGRPREAADALREAVELFSVKGATAYADRARTRLEQIEG